MRENFINAKKEPNVFDLYKWEGIEWALWPNLYPLTSWCDSIDDGSFEF